MVILALGAVSDPAVDEGCGVGIEPQRLRVIGGGAVIIFLGPVGMGAVVIGFSIVGREPDCLAKVCDGAVKVVLFDVNEAATFVGEGAGRIFRIEPDPPA